MSERLSETFPTGQRGASWLLIARELNVLDPRESLPGPGLAADEHGGVGIALE